MCALIIANMLTLSLVTIYTMKINIFEDIFSVPSPMNLSYSAIKRGVEHVVITFSEAMNGNYNKTKADVTDTVTPFSMDMSIQGEKLRFALCSSYYEQQINALYNMWSFQKWANATGFRVPEPFVSNSTLGLANVHSKLYHENFTMNALKFSDYFDLDLWTKKTKDYGIPPLVKWNTFVLSPIKTAILVTLTYWNDPPGIYKGDKINKHKVCLEDHKTFYNSHVELFDQLQIQVVRNVCFAFSGDFHPTLHQFNSAIMENFSDVTVWFSSWRGIRSDRISIKDHKELRRVYEGRDEIQAMVRSSPAIMRDSRKYINTILKTEFNEYTAVAFRVGNRRAVLVEKHYSRKAVMQYFQKCAEDVQNVLLKNPSNPVVLSSDLGRFGDQTFNFYFGVDNMGTKLLKFILDSVYGNKSIDDYDNEFLRAASGTEDTGYIGSMQKAIAENAKHLIVVGGYSNFQDSIVRHFKANHQNYTDCLTCICYAGPIMTAVKENKPYVNLCRQH